MEIGAGAISEGFSKENCVDEMTIVNWEKGKTKSTKKNSERLQKLLGIEPPIH
jgi:hypothetical protein